MDAHAFPVYQRCYLGNGYWSKVIIIVRWWIGDNHNAALSKNLMECQKLEFTENDNSKIEISAVI